MSSAASSNPFPPNLSILGGIPLKGQDLAASIIFAVAYFVLLPLVAFRLFRPSSRCLNLLRPSVFVLIRVITFIIRSVQSNGNYGTGLFIGEQILLLCGFVLLCEPLLGLAKLHITRNSTPSDSEKPILHWGLRVLQLALIVALILGIVAGTKYGDLDNAATLNSVKSYRDANAAICLAITALAGVIVIVASFKEPLPWRQTAYLLIISVLLSTVSVYKIVVYVGSSPPSPLHAGTKAAFYCLVSLPEFLVVCLFLAVNLNEDFNIPEAREKEIELKNEYGSNNNGGNASNARKVAGKLPVVRLFV